MFCNFSRALTRSKFLKLFKKSVLPNRACVQIRQSFTQTKLGGSNPWYWLTKLDMKERLWQLWTRKVKSKIKLERWSMCFHEIKTYMDINIKGNTPIILSFPIPRVRKILVLCYQFSYMINFTCRNQQLLLFPKTKVPPFTYTHHTLNKTLVHVPHGTCMF